MSRLLLFICLILLNSCASMFVVDQKDLCYSQINGFQSTNTHLILKKDLEINKGFLSDHILLKEGIYLPVYYASKSCHYVKYISQENLIINDNTIAKGGILIPVDTIKKPIYIWYDIGFNDYNVHNVKINEKFDFEIVKKNNIQ